MKALKWIFGILVSLVLVLAALVAIDISPYFALISAEHPTPQPYQTPSGIKIELRSDIVSLTASEMAHKIREKELSSVEVVEAPSQPDLPVQSSSQRYSYFGCRRRPAASS